MFQNSINQYYTGQDATLEMIVMLLGAFILGWLLRYFIKPNSIDDNHVCSKKCSNWEKCKNCDHCNGKVSSGISSASNHSNFTTSRVEDTRFSADTGKKDDLKIVEGIGPKVEELLNRNGVHSFSDLENLSYQKLSDILRQENGKFQMLVRSAESWSEQSKLAAKGDFDALKVLQDSLTGGR